MIIKSEKIGLILLLCLSLTSFSGSQALADNTLNQVDVRRSASDGLEFTLYTSSPYADNVVVTKKSDNKYVILMPNVNGASGAKPDFTSVKDIVSDVDVRAIDDGQNGYTKVTVITNRPVDIKTNTAKSSPVTQEQREYRALIAQQKAKPAPQTPAQTAQSTPQAQSQKAPAFKLPEIQPTKTAADIAKSKTAAVSKQSAQAKAVSNNQTKPVLNKKTETKIANVQPKQETNIKKVSAKKTEQPKTSPASNFDAKAAGEKISENLLASHVPSVPAEEAAPAPQENTLVPMPVSDKNNILDIKNNILGRIPQNMPATLAIVFIPLICIIALFNLIKNSLRRSQIMKNVFLNNIASKKQAPAPSYDNIINNENLSWQEKYQQYMDASGQNAAPQETSQYKILASKEKPVKIIKETPQVKQKPQKAVNNTPAPKKSENMQQPKKVQPVQQPQPAKPVSKNRPEPKAAQPKYVTDAESRIQKFERLLQASPSVEKTNIEEDIKESENNLSAQNSVAEETTAIHNEINKTVRLKAFAEKMALEETQRNKRVKHRRVQLELPKEAPHVNLGYSQLHSNPRSFKDANLSVSDLIAKSDRLLNKKTELKTETNDYDMITVDEYFNIINDDKSKVTSSLSEVVAEGLANMRKAPAPKKAATNPIEALRNETRENNLSGLIIKSGYDIDKDRGFYLVSLDGKSAIIGKSGEEIFVLKKFDRNIVKPLQVRMDNPNVYMVKADNFKSLVEVQKDKMGVLIEL